MYQGHLRLKKTGTNLTLKASRTFPETSNMVNISGSREFSA